MATRREAPTSAATGKYLTFRLGTEEYGIEVEKVERIIGLTDITPVPRMPQFLKGVINLRGRILPVVDLRSKFGMPPLEGEGEQACIVVVEVPKEKDVLLMGALVDSVSEVLDIPLDAIDPPTALGADCDTELLLGLARAEDGIKILLDTDSVLTGSEAHQVSKVALAVGEMESELE